MTVDGLVRLTPFRTGVAAVVNGSVPIHVLGVRYPFLPSSFLAVRHIARVEHADLAAGRGLWASFYLVPKMRSPASPSPGTM